MWDTHWRDKLHDPIPGRKLTINVFKWQKLLTIDKKPEKCESHVWCCYTPLIANWASGLSSGAVNFVNSVRQSGNKLSNQQNTLSYSSTSSQHANSHHPNSHSPIAEDFAPRIP